MIKVKPQRDYRSNYENIRGLLDLILDLPLWVRDQPMIEVGSNTGDSTQIFSLFFKKLYSVDNFEDDTHIKRSGEEIQNLFNKKVGWRGIVSIKGRSDEVLFNPELRSKLPTTAAVIYIDADHAYRSIKNDIINYWPLVQEGGVLCGHDYGLKLKGRDGVERAVCELFGEPDRLYMDTSWLVLKNKNRSINLE